MKPDTRFLALLGVVLLTVVAGCLDAQMPTTEEVHDVFTEHSESHVLEIPEPEGVQALDASELGGWRLLCDQCHQGPHYSSQSFLIWGHLDSCLSETTCLECHGSKLHRLDVRGSKSRCIECHMEMGKTLECTACHIEGWGEMHTPENHSKATHGQQARQDALRCASCHGSRNWCSDCHGLPMPHPDTIIRDHPTLVRGNPDSCTTCHGERACEQCHTERGIAFN